MRLLTLASVAAFAYACLAIGRGDSPWWVPAIFGVLSMVAFGLALALRKVRMLAAALEGWAEGFIREAEGPERR